MARCSLRSPPVTNPAAALVGRDAVVLGFDGHAGARAARGAARPRVFTEYPDAALASAWLGVTTGNADAIRRSLMLAHQADRGMASVDVAAALVGSLIGVGRALRGRRPRRGGHLVQSVVAAMKGAAELAEKKNAQPVASGIGPTVIICRASPAAALAHLALLDLAAGERHRGDRTQTPQGLLSTSTTCVTWCRWWSSTR